MVIFDIETDGLLDDVTKFHVLSYKSLHEDVSSSKDHRLLDGSPTLIGHDVFRYDLAVLKKLFGYEYKGQVIDTLALSWYLFPNRLKHGLEHWGEEFGIKKPPIDDWNNLTYEDYRHRCEQDVLITEKLYLHCMDKLNKLYKGVDKDINRIIYYLSFKMQCAAKQQEQGWKLDVERCKAGVNSLQQIMDTKTEELRLVMPEVPIYRDYSRPAKPYKKDGTLSVTGSKWFALLKKQNYPEGYDGTIKSCVGYNPPNPNSHEQVKDWLFSLGWKPTTFKFTRNKDGVENKIPQVRIDGDDGKELCPSVLKLLKKEPAIESLQGLTVAQHRLSILQGFLDNQVDGRIRAEINGLTNTLRFKHKTVVNLPGVGKPYGSLVRGCLIANDNEVLCGSDMASLESMTKRHFMYPYDPDYVEEMSKPGFDEHLDLAKAAGKVTQEQIDAYNQGDKSIKPIRNTFKPVNYGCVYGLQAKRLAREQGWTVKEAQDLIDIYWKRNWSVKKLSEDQEIRYLGGEMWLVNPVNGFCYSLRHEKDIFSTLNQGTGCYCFDKFVYYQTKQGWWPIGQFHDEVIHTHSERDTEKVRQTLGTAIDKVNEELQLNVKLGIAIQFGKTYADIH